LVLKPIGPFICPMLLQFVDTMIALNNVDILMNKNIFSFENPHNCKGTSSIKRTGSGSGGTSPTNKDDNVPRFGFPSNRKVSQNSIVCGANGLLNLSADDVNDMAYI
jgi:hypothetical protein